MEENNLEVITFTKKGKPRKRKPKEPREYFNQATEDAIIRYVAETDQDKRNQIYNKYIAYSFYKLSENIIHTFKFYYTDNNTIEDLKHEVVAMLLDKLQGFNHSKSIDDRLKKIIIKEFGEHYEHGSFRTYTNNATVITQHQIDDFIVNLKVTDKCYERIHQLTPPKAFSYFGTIVKRYLIVYNEENYEKLQNQIDIVELNKNDDNENYTRHVDFRTSEEIDLYKFVELYVVHITDNIYKLFPKQKDAQVADAILELFRKRETLNILENKKALYIYIREIIDVETPHITKISKRLKVIYKELFNHYYEHGNITKYL